MSSAVTIVFIAASISFLTIVLLPIVPENFEYFLSGFISRVDLYSQL